MDKRWKRVLVELVELERPKQVKIPTELNECYSTASLSQDGPSATQTVSITNIYVPLPSSHPEIWRERENIDTDSDPVYEQIQ